MIWHSVRATNNERTQIRQQHFCRYRVLLPYISHNFIQIPSMIGYGVWISLTGTAYVKLPRRIDWGIKFQDQQNLVIMTCQTRRLTLGESKGSLPGNMASTLLPIIITGSTTKSILVRIWRHRWSWCSRMENQMCNFVCIGRPWSGWIRGRVLGESAVIWNNQKMASYNCKIFLIQMKLKDYLKLKSTTTGWDDSSTTKIISKLMGSHYSCSTKRSQRRRQY